MGYIEKLIAESEDFLGARSARTGNATDAVQHDLFDAEVFKEMLADAPALQEMVDDLGAKHDYTTDLTRDVMMEFWQSEPELRDIRDMAPSHLANQAVAENLDRAPETMETRGFTRNDRYGATMATIAVTEKVRDTLDNLPEDMEQAVQDAEQAQQQSEQANQQLQDALPFPIGAGGAGDDPTDGGDGPGGSAGAYDGEGPLTEPQQAIADAIAEALANAQTAAEAADAAADEAADAAEIRAARLQGPIREGIQAACEELASEAELLSSWGVEDGEIERMNFEERKALIKAIRRNRMNEFMQLIGRFRLMVAAEQTHHTEYGRDEVYDTELSDRLPDVLNSEWARFFDPDLELTFLADFAEGSLLSKKYRGLEKVGKGALVLVGDCSDSMKARDKHGVSREAWLKAFTMALLFQAKLQNRDFEVILFSSAHQQKRWTFPKGQAKIADVMAMVEFFWAGGTDFQVPLTQAADLIQSDYNQHGPRKADVVLVTDGSAHIDPAWLRQYTEHRDKIGYRVFGVAIGQPITPALQSVSNDVRHLTEFIEPHEVADLIRML